MKNLTKMFLAACLLAVFAFSGNAQSVGINGDGSVPDNSAMLDVKSTSKGFLPPRMTTAQRNLIPTPVEGLVIYNTDEKTLNIYNGNSWGFIIPFFCGQTFSDPRDGRDYETVQIGTQCWMAQNLAYLPSVVGPGTRSDTDPYFYVYGYDGNDVAAAKAIANYQNYGVLYNWPAASLATTCPTGWHLPTDAEWTALTTYVSNQPANKCNNTVNYIAKALAAKSAWTTATQTCAVGNNLDANNATGFTALPGGYLDDENLFLLTGIYGIFWSSTQNSSTIAWSRILFYDDASVASDFIPKSFGFSVRCMKD